MGGGGLNSLKPQKAFTLAEVLITLAIIGIIATLTISPFIRSHEKHTYYAKFAKMYSVLNSALNRAIIEKGNTIYWSKSTDCADFIKHFRVQKECTGSDDSNCFAESYKTINGRDVSNSYLLRNNSALFDRETQNRVVKLQDGSIIRSMGSNVSYTICSVTFDTNGPKGPNVAGRDLFVLAVYENNTIAPPSGWYNGKDSNGKLILIKPDMDGLKTGCKNDSGTGVCSSALIREKKMDY